MEGVWTLENCQFGGSKKVNDKYKSITIVIWQTTGTTTISMLADISLPDLSLQQKCKVLARFTPTQIKWMTGEKENTRDVFRGFVVAIEPMPEKKEK